MDQGVEVRDQLSRREIRTIFDKTAQIVDRVRIACDAEPADQEVPHRHRRWRLLDRLGEQVIRQLVTDSRSGVTKPELVARYHISRSSVKRILKQARRDE